MSKHNYSQYSNKNRNEQNKPANVNQHHKPKAVVQEAAVKPAAEVKMEVAPAAPVVMQETVETVSLPNTVKGVVTRCTKLNVRENATVNAPIVCVLDAMAEVEVDAKKSTSNWFYIYTAAGAEGYCMREYINAHM